MGFGDKAVGAGAGLAVVIALCMWVFAVLTSLALPAVIIWAIYEIVKKFVLHS